MEPIRLYDVVELTDDVPDTPLRAGMVGTVIDEHATGALEVEFEALEEVRDEVFTVALSPSRLILRRSFAAMEPRPARIATR